MQTATLSTPRTTILASDFALITIWIIACMVLAHGGEFMDFALIGGAVMIAREFYGRLFLGEQSQGLLAIAAAAPIFLVVSGLGLDTIIRTTPITFDPQLAVIDHGIAPAVRTWCLARPWAICPLDVAYDALPLAMMIGAIFATKGDRAQLLKAAVLGGLLVVPWYLILPAVGPAHLGDPHAPRNCMPSMHCTWALLIWQSQRGWLRYPAGAFAVLTFAATLATGEHYTPDLAAALPWTWTLSRLAGKSAWRKPEFEGGKSE